MRLRTVVILIVLVGSATTLFALAPVVSTSIKLHGAPIYVNGTSMCGAKGCSVVAYQSLSCAVLGVGGSYSTWTGTQTVGTWSYQSGCLPKTLYAG
ncbi:MAG: hypothetical protein ACLP9K_08435 [Nitrososphaerales archaeon]